MSIDASQSVGGPTELKKAADSKLVHGNQTDGQAFRQILANQNIDSSTSSNAKRQNITIKWGDTVSELAEKYNTSTAAITAANNLQNPDFILAGNRLVIPGSSKQTTVAAATTKTATPSSAIVNAKYESSDSRESSAEAQARDYIVEHESGGNYNARNGKYIGKYQLDSSYLKGDYSPANQERVANHYVAQRYGTWVNAMQHWKSNNWY